MQILQPPSILLDFKFETEMVVSSTFEAAEKTTRRFGTPCRGLDRFRWPVLNRCSSVQDLPFQIEKGQCAALMPWTRRSKITIKVIERYAPVHVEPDIVGMLPDRKLLTVPDSLIEWHGEARSGCAVE